MLKDIYKDNFSFGEIFSKALTVFTENAKYILLITLLIYVPVNIALFYVGESMMNSPDLTLEQFTNYMRIAGWLEGLIGVIASIFVILLVKDHLDGNKKTFKELLQYSFSKWASAVGGNILYGIGVVLLMILLIIPGIIFGVYWMFFIYAIVLKDISASKSLDYSKELVKGRWWEIFGYGLFSFITTMLLGLALGFVPFVEIIFVDVLTSLIIDLYVLFTVIIFTLKFLNLDKSSEDKKEVIIEKEKIEDNVEDTLQKEKHIEL